MARAGSTGPREFGQLCGSVFGRVWLLGLFHARKLRVHELALGLGWDAVHDRLRITKPFYDRFTPAISARDFALHSGRLDAALDFLAVCLALVYGRSRQAQERWRSFCTRICPTSRGSIRGHLVRNGCGRRSRRVICRYSMCRGRSPITVSLTPVLCDQLESPGRSSAAGVFCARSGRSPTDATSKNSGPLERSNCVRRAGALRSPSTRPPPTDWISCGGRICSGALGEHASWTSAATHAVLPLLATDTGIALQVDTGVASYRRRFGGWAGGFWLPECAHAPWLDPLLEEAGVRHTCVELTGVLGIGDLRNLVPLATQAGPVLWPVDRQAMALVWSEGGYPASGAYRDYHALSTHHHRVWRNDGEPYDAGAARTLAAQHAKDFVGRVAERVGDGGICVCALDTELLGHWWYEGVHWLAEVLEECARTGLPLTTLDEALERQEPVPAPRDLGVTSWGEGGDLRTWSGPAAAQLAWQARTAELRVLAAAGKRSERAVRELLALQSSDWAFLVSRALAGDYARARADGHLRMLERAMVSDPELEGTLRNLAPELAGWLG